MLIKARLIILAVFSLVVTATIGLILFQDSLTVKKEIEKQEIISEIRNKIFERAVLRNEYFLYREARPIVQLQLNSEALGKLLMQASSIETWSDGQVLISRLGDNIKFTDQTLSQIVVNFSAGDGSAPGGKSQDRDPSVSSTPSTGSGQAGLLQASAHELEQRLISQILIKSQENFAISSQLSEASRNKVTESQQKATFFILVSVVGIILIIIFALYFIWLSIAKPLLGLKESALRIASLDFSSTTTTTTTTDSNDEIGQLARAFNTMVFKIKESYTGLEEKVRDRTQNLEDAKIAARNVLEDLQVEKEKLAEAKAKDEALLGSIGDGVIATDDKGRIILINTIAEKLLGKEHEEVLGKFASEHIPLEDEKGVTIPLEKRPVNMALAGTTTTTTTTTTTGPTYYYVRPDKIKFPVAITVTPIILGDKIIGTIEIFRDITKEKEIDKAKTEFISLASHQLRTPLTTISWYTEMILKGDVGQVIPGQKKYLEEIYGGDQRMIELVNTLLDVSRLELGTFVIRPEPVQLTDIAESVLGELKPQIATQKLTIDKHYDPSLPVISADPKFMRIIFQNLLSNAVKYTSINGEVRLDLSIQGLNALIKVWNNGVGIPKEAQSKIFTKFFRDDLAKQKDPDGNGLGLYIVKSIIEKSGGKIWFESEENKGTTFYVTLPFGSVKKKENTE